MKILLLAPQPFYQERGTPIAVDLMVRLLSERGHQIDLLVYHEGKDVQYPGVRLHRIPRPPLIHNVPPGFSLKKLVCDAFMFWHALTLAHRQRPDLIHAVEESAFMAWVARRWWGIPYVYDMDSSLPDQIVEKLPFLRPMLPLLRGLIRPVLSNAVVLAPVCEALAETTGATDPLSVVILRDVSLLEEGGS